MYVHLNGNERVDADVLIYFRIIFFPVRAFFLHTNTLTDFGDKLQNSD